MTGSNTEQPRVSVVIPTSDGYRGGLVPRLLASLERQTYRDFETLLIKGVAPQGKAINQGAAQARGAILVILDDDSELADVEVLERLVAVLDSDPGIGMAGASIVVAPDATPFQRRAAAQFPRFQTPVVDRVTDSDLACHGCCAFPRAVFDAIGGEREDLLRGLDPDLRMRLRAAGYRVVLVPDARIYHPMPSGWKALIRIFFRNGFGSAYAYKFQPDSVYETHEALHDRDFQPRTTLFYRVLRFPLRLLRAMGTGQWLRLVAYTSYAFGYVWGLLTARAMGRADAPRG
jgi:GT2 family glycosyltransferase